MAIAAAIVAGVGVVVGGTAAVSQGIEASDAAGKKINAARKAEQESQSIIDDFNERNNKALSDEEKIRNNTDRKAEVIRKKTNAGTGRRSSIIAGADNAKANNVNTISEV